MGFGGVHTPVTVSLFISCYWCTLLLLVLLLRGRVFSTLTYWWELAPATRGNGGAVLTLVVLLWLSGLPPFPTFFVKVGLLSQIYGRGGWGVTCILLCSVGVGWVVYVGSMLLLSSGSGLVVSGGGSGSTTSHVVWLGTVTILLCWLTCGLCELETIIRWAWI